MAIRQCHLLFHDESCNPGDDCFIVGVLKVYERGKLEAAIKAARDKWHFSNELHFSKMSNLRMNVYKEVFDRVSAVKDDFHFSAICVKRDKIDINKYFSGQKHLAYNYFTKLLLKHRCKNVADAELVTDEKTRRIEDNFVQYIEWEINQLSSSEKDPITKVTVKSSKESDLLQLTDLLTGATGAILNSAATGRKKEVAIHALRLGLLNDRWVFEPKR